MDMLTQLRMKEMELLAQRALIDDGLKEIRAGIQVATALTQKPAEPEPEEASKE